MITFEKQQCSGCGLCAKICHEHCIALIDGLPCIDGTYCSTCTQCIAICPQRCLTWDGVSVVRYERTRLPSPDQLDELFKERRSIRQFKKQKLERVLIEAIVGYAIYAPTENFNLRVIVVDDDRLLAALEQTLMQLTRRFYNLLFRPGFFAVLARWFGFAHTFRRTRIKMETVLSRRYVWPTSPAAFIFIVGDKRIPLSDASAQYALANMMYYAQVNGIGSCLCGNGPLLFDRNRRVRQQLGLRNYENILGALTVGYPAIRFSNKVQGKALHIQWNAG